MSRERRPHLVPGRPFAVGNVFIAPRGRVIAIHALSGRGRNRAAQVADFDDGVRQVSWQPVGHLRRLLELRWFTLLEGRHCRVCGCTDNYCRACIAIAEGPCSWANEDEPDLCSACEDRRLPDAHQDGVVTHAAGGKLQQNPFTPHADLPNDLYEHWRAGWLVVAKDRRTDTAVAAGDA
jgi:hypothetical protein